VKRNVPKARDIPSYPLEAAGPGSNTPLLDALELNDRRCGICEEPFTERQIEVGDVAEMFKPDSNGIKWMGTESKIVHAECGLSHGWEVA